MLVLVWFGRFSSVESVGRFGLVQLQVSGLDGLGLVGCKHLQVSGCKSKCW